MKDKLITVAQASEIAGVSVASMLMSIINQATNR